MLTTLSDISTVTKLIHPENASSPIIVILSGIIISVSELQPENTPVSIIINPSERMTLLSEKQFRKAFLPMFVILSGIITFVKELHP